MEIIKYKNLINNKIENLENKLFTAIIGESPSSGARSPILWNAAFKALTMNCRMIPLDVSSHNLDKLIYELDNDKNFVGGSVTIPYKEKVARWLGQHRLSDQANAIGAVNCIYRNKDKKIVGTNTDGEASLVSFEKEFGSVAGKKILILGPGGAGKAVIAYFTKAALPDGHVTVAGRLNTEEGKKLTKKLNASLWIQWEEIDNYINNIDVLINCTNIGFGKNIEQSPITINQINKLKKNCIVYDIIYQPHLTRLLTKSVEKKLKILNGLSMNLEQAVLAFGHAHPKINDFNLVRKSMKNA